MLNLSRFKFTAPGAQQDGQRSSLFLPRQDPIVPRHAPAGPAMRIDTRNFQFSFLDHDGSRRYADVNNGRATDRFTGRVLFSLTEADVHVPEEAAANYLAGYTPFDYMADECSGVVMVDHDEDYRRDFSSDNAFRRVNVKGSAEGAIPEIDPLSSVTKYKTVDRICGSFVSLVTEQNAKPNYRVRQVAARRIGDALALDREIDVFDATIGTLGASANWNANNVTTLGSGTYWDTGADSDPLGDIDHIVGTASFQRVTKIVMPYNVMLVFLKHPSVRDQLRTTYGDERVRDFDKLAAGGAPSISPISFEIPGYPPFVSVQSRVLNESTGAIDYILNNMVLLLRTLPKGGVPLDGRDAATSYTFRVRGNLGVGYETREYRVEGRGQRGGTMVVAYMSDIAQMTGSNIGGMIKAVLAP